MVRVRFAPSPTGLLHIGNARTALFNYLFARKNHGKFILRIEDTDTERSKKEFEESIIEDLKWLGLTWDEGPDCGGPYGPYRQTERLHLYREYASKLLSEGKAYRCWCTKEEIEKRVMSVSSDRTAGYDNYCRNLTETQIKDFQAQGRKPVLRFKVPHKEIVVNDIIRGNVRFEPDAINDFVIMKSNEIPTFHFAVVIDDLHMQITHVIRGEDHLSNTPKHILIFEALGYPVPMFAHMSMTLGPDRTRLSKRHGATSVRQYREKGFLSDAMFNYLALLGWSSKDNQEIFSREQLMQEFSLEACNRSNAIFDPAKLLWLNSQYMRAKSAKEIFELASPFFEKVGYHKSILHQHRDIIEKAIEMEKEKLKTLEDVVERTGYFITEDISWDVELTKKFKTDQAVRVLCTLKSNLEQIQPFEKHNIEDMIRKFCQENHLKTGEVFHPLRFALTGATKGPGLFELIELLGKQKTLKRIEQFLANIRV
ncbi:MAG TPA: glutamate--tRNA ligase [bacterium]|nr:glutamate--tRNA ligase [bacterium]HOL34703.1 glutamate--tRNA ligase [bacterium]HPP08044.1 glutamate--tRNA ligase [bacterium]